MTDMNVLGIDTSCDDTAVVADGRVIRSSVIMSQTRLHAEHGGVVPEVASRRHLEDMRPAVTRALEEAGIGLGDLDMVGVRSGVPYAGGITIRATIGLMRSLRPRHYYPPISLGSGRHHHNTDGRIPLCFVSRTTLIS